MECTTQKDKSVPPFLLQIPAQHLQIEWKWDYQPTGISQVIGEGSTYSVKVEALIIVEWLWLQFIAQFKLEAIHW